MENGGCGNYDESPGTTMGIRQELVNPYLEFSHGYFPKNQLVYEIPWCGIEGYRPPMYELQEILSL